jgi:hypothetical protein
MNLRDRFLVESLTRRRRVTCELSGVAVVEGRDLESRQLLDAAGYDALLMTGPEELEVSSEAVGDQGGQVEAGTGTAHGTLRGHWITSARVDLEFGQLASRQGFSAYHPYYGGAFLLDPEGNTIEVGCREAVARAPASG